MCFVGWTRVSAGALALLLLHGCEGRTKPEKPQGAALFGATCARCHGLNGSGARPSGMGPRAQDLGDPAFQAARTDAQLKSTLQNGKPPNMPPFSALLDDEQIESLVRHIRKLKRK